jgi:hypothetical protein
VVERGTSDTTGFEKNQTIDLEGIVANEALLDAGILSGCDLSQLLTGGALRDHRLMASNPAGSPNRAGCVDTYASGEGGRRPDEGAADALTHTRQRHSW